MDTILVKIFATALALSEVMTQPQAVKTQFDPVRDRDEVVQILRAGCAHMRKAFDVESINLDDLITTALNDPKAAGADIKVLHGIKFSELTTAYRQFCKNESIADPVVDLGEMIRFFNDAATDLPDPARLKNKKLPSLSMVLDGKGANFADVFEPSNRRIWISLADIPDFVQKAFVAAEDRRFYQHHGVDERGIIRAFIGNLADSGRPQGGSTITQQVVKNLLVGEDVTYERKMREVIVASRLENTLSKNEILELYLNSTYLGRGSWGIEMASRSYFGKSAKALTLGEGALLAGLLKGPSYFNPDRHPDRARDRLAYVLGRMQEDGFISVEQKDDALGKPPKLVAFERPRRNSGFHFVDYLAREAKSDGVASLTAEAYTVHSTIDAGLQRATEAALQEGLAHYEISAGRTQFRGPEANIADAVQKLAADGKADSKSGAQGGAPTATAAWQQALAAARLPLYDVHWDPAVILDKGGKHGDGAIRVGLRDGRVLPLTGLTGQARRGLSLYDVVYVRVIGSRTVEPRGTDGRAGDPGVNAAKPKAKPVPAGNAQAQLRARPTVQGAALVLENKTGRILAMAGSFSYPLSQLNRTSQTQRQPGSAIKPLTYLTALQKGLQPNTLVPDLPITLPPVGSSGRNIIAREYNGTMRDEDFWTPRNANYGSGGIYTMRRGLENSVNVVTAHLLDGGIDSDPEKSLDEVCATAVAARIYSECIRYYPFVLGAQPVRMIDLAGFYAAVANEGARPQPHAIDSIEAGGRTIYQYPSAPLPWIGAADRTSFYQLKTMLQGVVARGTARAIGALSPYVAGKTGTTEDAVDGWFVGFTNDVTVAVWVGYDNGDGKRRSLGNNETGARVALPIFEPIIEAVWAEHIAPKVPLAGPSAEAQRHLVDLSIDYTSGDRVTGGRGGFIEHFRLGPDGRFSETQYQLVSREDAFASRNQGEDLGADQGWAGWGGGGAPSAQGGGWTTGRSYYYPPQSWQPAPAQPPRPAGRGLFSSPWVNQDDPRNRARRDPDNFWGGRLY